MSTLPRLDAHGVVYGLPNADYHAGAGLSCTGAKRLLQSPYHYHALAQHTTAPPKEPTPSMLNGTLVHCATLEPEQFDERYEVGPDVSRNSKAWREFIDHCTSVAVEPISQLQRDRAYAQAAALRTLPDVAAILKRGHAESSAYWVDPITGVQCKCRPDFTGEGWGVSHAGVILLDVKTAADASPAGFAKSVVNYSYHQQADWYCSGYALATGREVLGMVFAVVESEYPHAVAAYSLDTRALEMGRKLNDRARALYAKCTAANDWPSYPTAVTELTLPAWAWRQADE
jgi:hypothetical protein